MKVMKKTNRKRLASLFLVLCFCFTTIPVAAMGDGETVDFESKISAELWEVMKEAGDDELIPVWIWMYNIDHEEISEQLEEAGYDPDIYEDDEKFYEMIVPEVAESIVARVGYEAAYYKEDVVDEVSEEEFQSMEAQSVNEAVIAADDMDENLSFDGISDDNMDKSISLVDRAVSAKVDEYLAVKRAFVKEECTTLNNKFISENIGKKEREILYNSSYTRTLIVEANKEEIIQYAKQPQVEEVTLHQEVIMEPAMDMAIKQVGADSVTGTKSSAYNLGSGYKGTGIKIGGGCFDNRQSI